MSLKPELLFNLLAFDHRGLWGSDDPVWAALKNLPWYVGSMLDHRTAEDPYRAYPDTNGIHPTVVIERPDQVLIARDAVIKPYTVIEGRAIIDDGAVVGPHAYLRDTVVIGRGARVGHGAEVKRSILFPYAKVAHKATTLDSILGHRVNFSGHLVSPNARFDEHAIRLRLPQGGRMETGLRKLGVIVGDDAKIACNVRLQPGDVILPSTRLV